MKFTFIDKESVCVYRDGKIEKYESAYITRYRENSKREQRNREWKKNSDLMMYDDFYGAEKERIIAEIHSVSPTLEENKLIYAFSVNETSGIYYKYIDDEKKTEAHFLSSNEAAFRDLTVSGKGEIAGAVQRDHYTSDIAVFSKIGGDYKCVTGGDSKDENPAFGKKGEIWFNSYGIGRDMENGFVRYMPSEIIKLDLLTMELTTVVSDRQYSYIKPIVDEDGNLYCIRKPGEEKKKRNVFLDIVLIPVRIVQAIVGFISMFVTIFAGKPLVEGKGKTRVGGGAAKNADGKTVFIHNHLLNVEKEMKKNGKSEDHGFIPHNWKLIKLKRSESDFSAAYDVSGAEELAHGAADFCITEENGENILVYTNGKHIFKLCLNGEKKKKKIVDTDFCVKLGSIANKRTESQANGETENDFFDSL